MRAKNMQALTSDFSARYPGVVIYGIGDDAHKTRTSDHNEDDTPGVSAAQSDSDSVPEHRAIDVMLGPAINRSQMRAQIQEILSVPANRDRLYYINFENSQWSRSNGFVERDNSDDPHPDHGHFSGLASADENTTPWFGSGGEMQARKGDKTDDVWRLHEKMIYVWPEIATQDPAHPFAVDGIYGSNTAWWVSIKMTGGPGDYVSPAWFDRLDGMFNDKKIAEAISASGGGPGGLVAHTHVVPSQSIPVSGTFTGSGSAIIVTTGDAVAS